MLRRPPFQRAAPGRYTLRTLAGLTATVTSAVAPTAPPQSMSALPQRKPAVAAPSTSTRARTDSDAAGGGFAG